MLHRTRHTPRDIVRLFTYIQSATPPGGAVDEKAVRAGTSQYCIEYLVPEMRNELVGLMNREQIELTFDLLGSLGRGRFKFDDLDSKARTDSRWQGLDTYESMQKLYSIGAVGNQERDYVTFKYRSPHTTFNRGKNIVMHEGLMTALNVSRQPRAL